MKSFILAIATVAMFGGCAVEWKPGNAWVIRAGITVDEGVKAFDHFKNNGYAK